MLSLSQILPVAISLQVFASNHHLSGVQANTNVSTTSPPPPTPSNTLTSAAQSDTADQTSQPNLNPDPNQTAKAVETIRTSARKDILVWQTELLETQKYFNRLKEQNVKEEKISQTEDSVFRQWADKTEERISMLLGAMTNRLNELATETTPALQV